MATKPGPFLGLGAAGHFELQTAYPAAKAITTASHSQLLGGFTHTPEFQMNAKGDAVQMRVAMNAPTTSSNTKFPRTEFREMAANGTSEMGFNPGLGYHLCQVTEAPTHLPPVKPSAVGLQCHNASSDLIELAFQPRGDYATSRKIEFVFRVNGTSSGLPRFSTDYVMGTKFTAGIAFNDGDWAIYYGDLLTPFYTSDIRGAPVLKFTGAKDCYFKAGCYAQSNATIDKASEYASVDLYSISSYHSVA
jgi:hypothetical protein